MGGCPGLTARCVRRRGHRQSGGSLCGTVDGSRSREWSRTTRHPTPARLRLVRAVAQSQVCSDGARRKRTMTAAVPPTPPQPSAPGMPFAPVDLDGAISPDDLQRPLYGASPLAAVKRFFRQYANFSGRASRSEFWWSQLFQFLLMLIPFAIYIAGAVLAETWLMEQRESLPNYASEPSTLDAPMVWVMFLGIALLGLVGLALVVPSLAVTARRLHDGNFSAWFLLLKLDPTGIIGGLILLVLCVLPSNAMGRRFDRGPKNTAPAPTAAPGVTPNG